MITTMLLIARFGGVINTNFDIALVLMVLVVEFFEILLVVVAER